MRVVIQRVSNAQVVCNNLIAGQISNGLLVFLGIRNNDTVEDVNWLVNKIIGLRVFSDENVKMNLSIKDIQGKILLVSQFTLYASTKKGNRPSFTDAAHPHHALPLYEAFIQKIKSSHIEVETGVFGGEMQITLTNEGPTTIIIDSKNRE